MFNKETCTPFTDIYDLFFTKITDDYYMEITKEQTEAAAQDLLLNAIPLFEFPKVPLDYVLDEQQENGESIGYFTHILNHEEKNILAVYMVVAWLGQQVASIQLVRMKYSGPDFKFTSQANHLQKLNALRKDYTSEGFHLQRLYKRRFRDKNGVYHSTFGKIMEPIHDLPKEKGGAPNDD